MKKTLYFSIVLLLIMSCKSDKKGATNTNEKELTTAEKIAQAHGIEFWNSVSQIDFTFNVDRDTTHFERSWSWKPKTGDVTLISGNDTITYNRKNVDSTSLNADKAFVNDKFWFLAPFQLVWDTGTTISEPIKAEAPMSKHQMNKISLNYTGDGGYTPGDAYDFYFEDDYLIKEWVFRKDNADEPSMATTWEDYEDFNELTISKTHKKAEGNWKLFFSNIKVSK